MATNTKAVRSLRKNLFLSNYQKLILIGSILGDGSLSGQYTKEKQETNYRLQVIHSEKQKEYLWWKYEIFRKWCLSPPKYTEKTHSWRFRTISHSELTEFHKIFYDKNGKKIIPRNICSFLNESLTLAVWFMDDGTKGPSNGYTLNSQSFSKFENQTLKNCLESNFGILVSLHNDRSKSRLYIKTHSTSRFEYLIRPFIVPSMVYKFICPRRD